MLARSLKILALLLLAMLPVAIILFVMASSPAPHYPAKTYAQLNNLGQAPSQNKQANTVVIDEAELNLLAQEIINSLDINFIYSSEIRLEQAIVNIKLSLKQPFFDTQFFNIHALAQVEGNALIINSATIGDISLHPLVISYGEKIALRIFSQHSLFPILEDVRQMISHAEINHGFTILKYNTGQVSGEKPLHAPKQTVDFYLDQLELLAKEITNTPKQSHRAALQLENILPALLTTANTRSENQATAMEEYSAIVIALSLHCADTKILQSTNWPSQYSIPSRKLSIGIHNRVDLGEHFFTSIAAYYYAGEDLALLIGIYKEILDVKTKGEFSLTDLTADVAGIEFSKLITNNDSLQWLQKNYQLSADDDNLLPLPNKSERASVDDILLLGKAALNTVAIIELKTAVNKAIMRSPLYKPNQALP